MCGGEERGERGEGRQERVREREREGERSILKASVHYMHDLNVEATAIRELERRSN